MEPNRRDVAILEYPAEVGLALPPKVLYHDMKFDRGVTFSEGTLKRRLKLLTKRLPPASGRTATIASPRPDWTTSAIARAVAEDSRGGEARDPRAAAPVGRRPGGGRCRCSERRTVPGALWSTRVVRGPGPVCSVGTTAAVGVRMRRRVRSRTRGHGSAGPARQVGNRTERVPPSHAIDRLGDAAGGTPGRRPRWRRSYQRSSHPETGRRKGCPGFFIGSDRVRTHEAWNAARHST